MRVSRFEWTLIPTPLKRGRQSRRTDRFRPALVPRTTASLLAPRQPSEPTQNQTAPASATFIYSNPRAAGNLTFSLAAVEDGGLTDLYFHLSAPAANSWVAVGIGAQMKGALMFLVYHDSRGESKPVPI